MSDYFEQLLPLWPKFLPYECVVEQLLEVRIVQGQLTAAREICPESGDGVLCL
jgi:hypothetical protein